MLLQYSYISLKQDALHWLRENGRLPSADINEYFQEIKERNDFKKKYELLDQEKLVFIQEKQALSQEKQALIEETEDFKIKLEAKDAEILALKAQIEKMN